MTMMFVIVLRPRFRQALVIVVLPGLAQTALALYAWFVAAGLGQTVYLGILYLPLAFIVTLLTPYNEEKLHFANFKHVRRNEAEIRFKGEQLGAATVKIRSQKTKVQEMEKQLRDARELVREHMSEGGALLARYEILHSDLKLGQRIGEGAFGTVLRGTLRGKHQVAIKTMRVSKITKKEISKFKAELIASDVGCPPCAVPQH